MKKYMLGIFIMFIGVLFIIIKVIIPSDNTDVNDSANKNVNISDKSEKETITNKEGKKVIININNKDYELNLENNKTVNEFVNILPIEFTMNELNGNEKYVYLNNTFTTNEYSPKHINKGDVMLYGNNCLVIFYKSFDTTYSYTKIGHIDNLDELDNSNIKIKISLK